MLGASPEAFSDVCSSDLPFVQLLITRSLALPRHIRCDHTFAAVLPNRVHKIPFPPEFPAPQLALHFRRLRKHFAREVFAKAPEVKRKLWGGEFWGKGYFVNTVGQHGSESVIAAYVARQGEGASYQQLHKGQLDLRLF